MNQHKSLSTIINKLQRKELLLHMEYNYEKETFKQQTEAMGIDRKVKRGMCWYPVSTGRSYYNSLNQLFVFSLKTPRETSIISISQPL